MNHLRQKRILELLQSRGHCSVELLAETLEVSEMTIRRDLRVLADAGSVVRDHGGATPAESVLFEFSFLERRHEQRAAKDAIGLAAAELVPDGASVILDSGTTTLAVAAHLRTRRKLTVITTSLPIASVLQRSGNADILLLGGFLRKDSPDLEGPMTEANLTGLRADIAILGADGIDQDGNTYSNSLNVARLLARAIAAAGKVYVVADSKKLNRSALTMFGKMADFVGLITDAGAPAALLARYRANGISVIVAGEDVRKPARSSHGAASPSERQ
jgi:DeoR/GlpR family transcriptional regulator of sugar metabolism